MGGLQEGYLPAPDFAKLTFGRVSVTRKDVLPWSDADLVRFVRRLTVLGSSILIR